MTVALFADLGEVGGGLRVTGDLLRLFRRHGLGVALFSSAPPSAAWQAALGELGVRWQISSPESAPRALGRVAIGICSSDFLARAPLLRTAGCRLVWLNCMPCLFPEETILAASMGMFDAYVFTSEFQRSELESELTRLGYRREQGHLIRDPFEIADWPFDPARPAANFVIGKLARPDLAKWSRKTWSVLERISPHRRSALLLGVDLAIQKWLGPTPSWAEVLPPGAIPAQDFYRRIHCLLTWNYALLECWPRIGLEAMACGVPIIAPREGGWCDMINHGQTGFLASSTDEMVQYANALAADETLRLQIAHQARQRLETELASEDLIWSGWERILQDLCAA